MSRLVVVMSVGLVASIASNCAAQVPLVQNGEAVAVVVTADDPSPTARYAAEELVSHVREATGATLPVVAESAIPDGYAGRVFVGATDAARAGNRPRGPRDGGDGAAHGRRRPLHRRP